MNMHTGRNDDLRRSRTRRKVRLLPDASDESTGFRIHDNFEGFSQVDDVFCRSRYDPEIKSSKSERFYDMYRKPLADWRGTDGYQQHDYAFPQLEVWLLEKLREFPFQPVCHSPVLKISP